MIHVSDIQKNNVLLKMNDLYQESETYFSEKLYKLQSIENALDTSNLFAESTDVYSEGVSDALKSIGNKIIEIVERCKKFVTDMIDKFNHFLWTNKDEDKVFKQLEKKRPDIAEQVRVAVEEDKIKLNNFRDLSAFYREIDNVLKEIEVMDGKTAKAKLAKAEKKLSKAADFVIKVGAVAGAIVSMHKLKDIIKESTDDSNTKYIAFKDMLNYMRVNGKKDGELEKMKDAAREMGEKIKSVSKKVSVMKESDALEKTAVKEVRTRESVITVVANCYERVTNSVISKRVKGNMTIFNAARKMKNSFKGVE